MDKGTDQPGRDLISILYLGTKLNVTYTIFFSTFQMNSGGPLKSEYSLGTTGTYQYPKHLTNQENLDHRSAAQNQSPQHEFMKNLGVKTEPVLPC